MSYGCADARIRGINPFLTWLYENDLINENLKIKKPKLEQKVMKTFTESLVSSIIKYTEKIPKDKYELRLHTLLLLLLIQASELIRSLLLHVIALILKIY